MKFRIISFLLDPFLRILFLIRSFSGKEDLNRKAERFGVHTIQKKDGDYIWFHAASVGEIRSLSFLIPSYKDKFADNILITTTTKTGQKTAEELFPYASIQYIPYDLKHFVDRFLDYWNPLWCCLIDSEIWPCFIYSMYKRQIRIYLINGRISKKSYKLWKRFSFALRVFQKIRCIWTTSDDLKKKFKDLQARHVEVFPNLKFFAPKLEVSDSFTKIKEWIGERPTWCIASTHYPEEEIAIRLHKRLKEYIPNIVTIIIPRHPNRAHGFIDVTFSSSLNNESGILMHDSIGGLGTFYSLSKIVVMGKTFSSPSGGHNPIEPLLFENLVIFGKNMSNFDDVTTLWGEDSVVCNTEDELFESIKFYIQNTGAISEKITPVIKKLEKIRADGLNDLINEVGR